VTSPIQKALDVYMPTPSLSHCKHWSTVSEKHGNQFRCQHLKVLSVRCWTDWKQSLTRTAAFLSDPEMRRSCVFAGSRCDSACVARRYCTRCNSTAAAAADSAAITLINN